MVKMANKLGFFLHLVLIHLFAGETSQQMTSRQKACQVVCGKSSPFLGVTKERAMSVRSPSRLTKPYLGRQPIPDFPGDDSSNDLPPYMLPAPIKKKPIVIPDGPILGRTFNLPIRRKPASIRKNHFLRPAFDLPVRRKPVAIPNEYLLGRSSVPIRPAKISVDDYVLPIRRRPTYELPIGPRPTYELPIRPRPTYDLPIVPIRRRPTYDLPIRRDDYLLGPTYDLPIPIRRKPSNYLLGSSWRRRPSAISDDYLLGPSYDLPIVDPYPVPIPQPIPDDEPLVLGSRTLAIRKERVRENAMHKFDNPYNLEEKYRPHHHRHGQHMHSSSESTSKEHYQPWLTSQGWAWPDVNPDPIRLPTGAGQPILAPDFMPALSGSMVVPPSPVSAPAISPSAVSPPAPMPMSPPSGPPMQPPSPPPPVMSPTPIPMANATLTTGNSTKNGTVNAGNSTMLGGNSTMLGGNSTMLGGNSTMLGGNSTMLGGNSTIGNSTTPAND